MNLAYLLLASQLKLPSRFLPPPRAKFAHVVFTIEPEHYQLRGVIKCKAIEPVLADLLSLCDSQTFFLDVGANVGLFSLLIASQTGANVLAIEPVRSTFNALVRNCSNNDKLNIAPLNLAIGACPSAIEITALPGSGVNHVVSAVELQGNPRQSSPQLALDQLCVKDLMGERRKLVIKIDVERYEFEVLKGAQRLLALDLPIALCIEVPPAERVRLEQSLGSCFHAFSPLRSYSLPVLDHHDPSNLFYVNDEWLKLA